MLLLTLNIKNVSWDNFVFQFIPFIKNILFISTETIILSLTVIVPTLISVAFFTLAERKTMALIQRRTGPNEVGFWGFLQPIADGLKLFFKEVIIPSRADKFFFFFAPVLAMTLAFSAWSLIPINFSSVLVDSHLSFLIVFALSSLKVYTIVFAGWSSNSKYAILGSVRAIAQLISYEIAMVFSVIPVIMLSGSLNLIDIINAQKDIDFFYLLPISATIFFICILAETNRAPFDLPEAEAEIVAGYNVEYSGIPFALFFLAEYCQIIIMSSLFVIFFWGGWWPVISLDIFFVPPALIFSFKTAFICFLFVFVRAKLPRMRYDYLMGMGWKKLIPFSIVNIFIVASTLLFML